AWRMNNGDGQGQQRAERGLRRRREPNGRNDSIDHPNVPGPDIVYETTAQRSRLDVRVFGEPLAYLVKHHRGDQTEQRPEHHLIRLAAGGGWEPESRAGSLCSTDQSIDRAKAERDQRGRIMGSHNLDQRFGMEG